MPLLFTNHIGNAVQSLRTSRSRTALTMLGVTVGIASITIILSLSGGATKVITDQVDELGGNIAVVRPGVSRPVTQVESITSPPNSAYATSTLSEEDIAHIRAIPNVQAVAPLMLMNGTLRAGDSQPVAASIVATTPDLLTVVDFPVRDGQFIDMQTNKDTATIGSQLSVDLFGTDQSIGKIFKVRGRSFTVIGILKPIGRPINYNNVDFDRAAFVNLEAGKSFNNGTVQLQQIDIKATSPDKMADVISAVDKTLKDARQGEEDYSILSSDELSRPTSQFFYTLAAAMTAVAAVSLIVGGIGIMNIMLVGVAERTREIGIRKALGASSGHITAQFLIESLAMSIGGGIGGYLFGYLFAFAISRTFLTFNPLFSWEIAAITIGVSVVVGTVFGLYPAVRAARKDPIEALRQYH